MIRYALTCDVEHGFDAWFRNSADYDVQAEAGLIECPHCGSTAISKAPMAPAIARSRETAPNPEALMRAYAARVRAHIRETHDYVGADFAAEARAIHEGEAEERPIWGEASPEEARALVEDGVTVAPLPAPFAPEPPALKPSAQKLN